MNDETKLMCLNILDTAEKIFDYCRPKKCPHVDTLEFNAEQEIIRRIEGIRAKLLKEKR